MSRSPGPRYSPSTAPRLSGVICWRTNRTPWLVHGSIAADLSSKSSTVMFASGTCTCFTQDRERTLRHRSEADHQDPPREIDHRFRHRILSMSAGSAYDL